MNLNNNIIRFIGYFTILILPLIITAQRNYCGELHLAKTFYFPGEEVEGVIFPQECSQDGDLIRVTLTSMKSQVATTLTEVNNSLAQFSINLPDEIEEGYYLLVLYDTEDIDKILKYLLIPILSREKVKNTSNQKLDLKKIKQTTFQKNELLLIPNTDLSTSQEFQVEIDLNSDNDERSAFLLSIMDLAQIGALTYQYLEDLTASLFPQIEITQKLSKQDQVSIERLSGRLINKSDSGVCLDCKVNFVVPGDAKGLQYSFVNSKGDFKISGVSFEGIKSGYFDFETSSDDLEYEFIFYEDEVKVRYDTTNLRVSEFKEYFQDEINENLLRKKIELHYQDSIQTFQKIDLPSLDITNIQHFNHQILIDEYKDMNNVREIIREIVPYVNIIRKNRIRVFSPEKIQNFQGSPLILIDGIKIPHDSIVLNLDPDNIEKIEVVNMFRELQQIGNLAQFGAVAIYTKNGFDSKSIPTLKEVDIKGVSILEDIEEDIEEIHLPDFRPVRYWKVFQIENKRNQLHLNLRAPSFPSNFRILIKGVIGRQRISSYADFRVELGN